MLPLLPRAIQHRVLCLYPTPYESRRACGVRVGFSSRCAQNRKGSYLFLRRLQASKTKPHHLTTFPIAILKDLQLYTLSSRRCRIVQQTGDTCLCKHDRSITFISFSCHCTVQFCTKEIVIALI